ncbi:hypothetical protein OS493_003198 [Desmophyllum pertusum]|uniref:Uncharacterized protein n=1 Tax=Desmophyllum pertusum TaxID=174260 RepID=A0A9W9YGM6_9CNID|nr:hypothetical protein OS493_003198 [Desmophyllum pertusum]
MKPQLIAFMFLVTFVISTQAYFMRVLPGKRGSILKKKTTSRWNSAGNTRYINGDVNKRLWRWAEDESDDTSNLNEMLE